MEEFDLRAFRENYAKGKVDPVMLKLAIEAARNGLIIEDDAPPDTPDAACESLSFLKRVDEYFIFARYISYCPDWPGDAIAFTHTGTKSFRTTVEWDRNGQVSCVEEEIPVQEFMNLISECQELDFLSQPDSLEGGVTYHMADDWFGLRLAGSTAKWMQIPGCASRERIEVDLKDLVRKYAPGFFPHLIDDEAGPDEIDVIESNP